MATDEQSYRDGWNAGWQACRDYVFGRSDQTEPVVPDEGER